MDDFNDLAPWAMLAVCAVFAAILVVGYLWPLTGDLAASYSLLGVGR